MKDLSVVIVGGGAGLGLLVADMAVKAGARAIGIIDLDATCGNPNRWLEISILCQPVTKSATDV